MFSCPVCTTQTHTRVALVSEQHPHRPVTAGTAARLSGRQRRRSTLPARCPTHQLTNLPAHTGAPGVWAHLGVALLRSGSRGGGSSSSTAAVKGRGQSSRGWAVPALVQVGFVYLFELSVCTCSYLSQRAKNRPLTDVTGAANTAGLATC